MPQLGASARRRDKRGEVWEESRRIPQGRREAVRAPALPGCAACWQGLSEQCGFGLGPALAACEGKDANLLELEARTGRLPDLSRRELWAVSEVTLGAGVSLRWGW